MSEIARVSHLCAGMGQPHAMAQAHAHAEIELNYIFSGSLRYFLDGRVLLLTAGSLAAFWAAKPHRTLATEPGTEFMWLTVPLTLALRWQLGATFMNRVLGGEALVDQASQPREAQAARQWVSGLASLMPLACLTTEREVQARLRRMATVGRPPSAFPQDRAHQHLEAITGFLGAHFRESIGLADVAVAVDLHPNHALTVFRQTCGMSIWQYVMRLRLAHAQAQLLTTDQPIATIARDAGFRTLSSFYDAFARECGMPPGEFRRRP
jgi:AraC family transcriptional regulator, melibiose operon regulatory protein